MALPTGIGVGTVVFGTGDISVSWPTHTTGDLGTLIVQSASEAITAPSGWTEYPNSPIGQGTAGAAGSVRIAAFYKFAASAAEAAVTVTDTGDHTGGFIMVNRGVDTGQPYDFTANSTSSGTSLSLPGGTTSSANRHIIQIVGTARDATATTTFSSWTNAALSTLTERKDSTTATGTGGGFGVVTGDKATAGAIGTTTVTQATADNVAMLTIALQPPALINAAPASYAVTFSDVGFTRDLVLNAEPASFAVTVADATLDYLPIVDETYVLNAEPFSLTLQFYNTGPYREATISTQIEYYPGPMPTDPRLLPRYLEIELLKLHNAIARIATEKLDA